jgi:hypothetical protein
LETDLIKQILSKMIKLPLILVSYIGLFFMTLFNMEEVSIVNNLPSGIAPGQKKTIQITIRKGDIKGFSKLEIPMPVGFNVSPGDIKGASFTFKAQSAKFVWMQLPEEPEFTITYTLEASSAVKGVYDIGGSFAYVKDNRRVDIKMPSRPLVITDKPVEEEAEETEVLASNSEQPSTLTETATVVESVEKAATPQAPLPTAMANTSLPANIKMEAPVVEMVCNRTITRISDNEFNVKLVIENNTITGFGKILETLPEHCKTEKINDAGAIVTQDKNTIKFVWFEIPTSNSIEVSYKVSCLKAQDALVIHGQLSYTDNGTPMVVPVNQLQSAEPILLVENQQPAIEKVETIVEQPINKTPEVVTPKENKTENLATNSTTNSANNNAKNSTYNSTSNNATAENKPSKTPVTSVPSAETGITYKVQILAAHRVVNKTYFEKNFNYTDGFNIENHEGWIKYTTGSFAQYKEARDARERITSYHGKLPGPFVTAYNDGQRITVQEALLISNQQWYK